MRLNLACLCAAAIAGYAWSKVHTEPATTIAEARWLAQEGHAYLGYIGPGGCGVESKSITDARNRLISTIHSRPRMVTQLLHDADRDARSAAICLVGMEELEQYAPLVAAQYAGEKDETIRLYIVQALGSLGGDEAVGVLRTALFDRSLEIWTSAANGLKVLGQELDQKTANRLVFESLIVRPTH